MGWGRSLHVGYNQDRLPVVATSVVERHNAAAVDHLCRCGRVRGAAAPPSTTTAAAVEKQRLNLICDVCTQAPKYISERLRVSALCWSHVSKTIASVTVLVETPGVPVGFAKPVLWPCLHVQQ